MSSDSANLVEKINAVRRKKRAVILAHNYQRPEIQDIADYVGDSIELSRRAMEEREAKLIVFCAVDFMAENGALLNPDKKVVIPHPEARCPMAQMLPATVVERWKEKYSGVPLVLYVNTLAEAKVLADVCCTSANAVDIVRSLDSDTVLFGPDYNLAKYVEKMTGKKVIPVPEHGFCPTHVLFFKEDLELLKERYPNAKTMAHPECTLEVQSIADFVGSTSQMCHYVKYSTVKRFIVATELGVLYRLKQENPGKEFIPAYEGAVCPNMKKNTLENLYLALRDEAYPIIIPTEKAVRARRCLDCMLSLKFKN